MKSRSDGVTWIAKGVPGTHPVIDEFLSALRERIPVDYFALDAFLAGGNSANPVTRLGALRRLIDAALARPRPTVVDFFPSASLIVAGLRRHVPTGLYVRTRGVIGGRLRRAAHDVEARLASRLARRTGVITRALTEDLHLRDALELPIGATIPRCDRWQDDPSRIRMIYVGKLRGRNIGGVLRAIARQASGVLADTKPIDITVLGSGVPADEIPVGSHGGRGHVTIRWLGQAPRDVVESELCAANVGLAYVPMTDWYDVQPPKKAYEYLCAGLVVIATRTSANAEILSGEPTARLVGDDPAETVRALAEVGTVLDRWVRSDVIERARPYRWDTLIEDRYLPFLRSLGL